MKRFFIGFGLLQLLLFTLELTAPVQRWFVVPFTEGLAFASTSLARLVDHGVVSRGIHLYDVASGFGMSIEAGCNGVEASIILLSAILAFPAPWRKKAWGLLVGLGSLHLLNLLRILSLFYLGQWSLRAFEWAHLYIWQVLILLDVFVVFLFWLRYLGRAARPLEEAVHG
ncbi:exosortase H [Pseudomonas sp. RIT-PI-AD]|uniref:exosortase H n=1 Tax=Pseudomonas sp. RIT-PI-AD TaxID=3035294 RepID=UPI0021DA8E13|nr:exosortase H [Pseudomonas sp. RIT-PI-AD]